MSASSSDAASAYFLTAWSRTGREEGGYVNDPRDSGGETNFGITIAVARANGYAGAMRDLPRETARRIAKAQYWNAMRLDEVSALSPRIAFELFDSGLNVGSQLATAWFQRCLNAAGANPGLRTDGTLGPLTLHALRRFLSARRQAGELVMLRALNAFQSVHYTTLAEMRPKDRAFWFGWQLNRVEIN